VKKVPALRKWGGWENDSGGPRWVEENGTVWELMHTWGGDRFPGTCLGGRAMSVKSSVEALGGGTELFVETCGREGVVRRGGASFNTGGIGKGAVAVVVE